MDLGLDTTGPTDRRRGEGWAPGGRSVLLGPCPRAGSQCPWFLSWGDSQCRGAWSLSTGLCPGLREPLSSLGFQARGRGPDTPQEQGSGPWACHGLLESQCFMPQHRCTCSSAPLPPPLHPPAPWAPGQSPGADPRQGSWPLRAPVPFLSRGDTRAYKQGVRPPWMTVTERGWAAPPPPPFRGPPAPGIGCSRVRRAGCQALKPPRAEEAEDGANHGLARAGCGGGRSVSGSEGVGGWLCQLGGGGIVAGGTKSVLGDFFVVSGCRS